MNTINLIIGIALLACILTPAYVLYFLKYQLFANQKRHKATIDTISNDLSKLHYEVEKIQFDEVENRIERNRQLLELTEKLDSSDMKHSMTQNNVDNINVSLDYLRRTLNSDMSKVNERFELQSALHTAFVAKSEESLEKSTSLLEDKFQSSLHILRQLQNDINSLQSLNEITQQILNRINSKQFAQEVLSAWMNTINQEKQEIDNQEETTTTEVKKEVKRRSLKKESKRKITSREIEMAFNEKTGLTYRGYVLKYGQEAFSKKKGNIYDSIYYQKFIKPKQQNLAFQRTDG